MNETIRIIKPLNYRLLMVFFSLMCIGGYIAMYLVAQFPSKLFKDIILNIYLFLLTIPSVALAYAVLAWAIRVKSDKVVVTKWGVRMTYNRDDIEFHSTLQRNGVTKIDIFLKKNKRRITTFDSEDLNGRKCIESIKKEIEVY